MSQSNHPSFEKIHDMALGHVFVSCVDILLNNIFSVSYYLFADGCFHYKLYYYLSDDVNLLTYQLFLQITIHGINSYWTPNCICPIIGRWHRFNCIYYKVFLRISDMCVKRKLCIKTANNAGVKADFFLSRNQIDI